MTTSHSKVTHQSVYNMPFEHHGGLFGRLGGLFGCLGALLGCLWAVLGATWAVLGQSWGPLGRSWSVGKPKSREPQKPSKPLEKLRFLLLGALLEGLLGRLGAILGVLERSFVGSGPFSIVWTAPRGGLGPFWGLRGRGDRPGGPRDKPRERPAAPGNLGVWALKKLQFWTSRGCMSLGALHFVPRARWRI